MRQEQGRSGAGANLGGSPLHTVTPDPTVLTSLQHVTCMNCWTLIFVTLSGKSATIIPELSKAALELFDKKEDIKVIGSCLSQPAMLEKKEKKWSFVANSCIFGFKISMAKI